MNYYSIHYGIKQIGRGGVPQARDIEMEPGKMATDDDFIWNIRGDRFPEFQPYVGTLILQKGSAVTDFISSAIISTGFVCSGKVQDIIRRYKIANTRYYDLGVKHKDICYKGYKVLHCINNYVDRIDYNRSVFQMLRIENNTQIGQPCEFNSLEEYRELGEQLRKNSYGDWQALEPVQIRFRDNYIPEQDIFIIGGLQTRPIFRRD